MLPLSRPAVMMFAAASTVDTGPHVFVFDDPGAVVSAVCGPVRRVRFPGPTDP